MRPNLRRRAFALCVVFAASGCWGRDVADRDLVGQWRADTASMRRLDPAGTPDARLQLAADRTFNAVGMPLSFIEPVVEPLHKPNDRISMSGVWELRERDGRQIVELSWRNPGVTSYSGELSVESGSPPRLYFHLTDPDENRRFVFERRAPAAGASDGVVVYKKGQAIDRSLHTMLGIHALAAAASDRDDGEIRGAIEVLIMGLPPSELARVGVMSGSVAYPGDAQDVRYDNYFRIALWSAVERLSRTPGRAGAKGLEMIARFVPLGGEREIFDGFVESQKKLDLLPPPPAMASPSPTS